MKAIIFLLFVILVFLIIRFTLNRIIEIRAKNPPKKQDKTISEGTIESEAMVQCALCGVHLPQSIAYFDGKDTFCSEGHMQEFQDKNR
jgi:uncharacterized protein